MGNRALTSALAAVVLALAVSSCGDGDTSSGGGGGDGGGGGPAAPDGSYASETGPNEESVTLEVEGGSVTHIKGKVYGECEGVTLTDGIDADVDVPIEDDTVDYEAEANGATSTLTGSFDDGTFEGTFAYVRANGPCPTEPYDFTASAK